MKKIFYSILIFLLILINFSTVCADDVDNEVDFEDTIEVTASNVSELPKTNSRRYIVYDRISKSMIIGKNEDIKSAMASTTKIMTTIVILEKADLNEKVTVSAKAGGTGGSRLGLKRGDKASVRDLLYGLMLRSGNDAAVALAEHVGGSVKGFAELMNEKAIELGLTNTHFVTPHGLDDANHYTTALELAKLTDYAMDNETFAKIVGTKTYGKGVIQQLLTLPDGSGLKITSEEYLTPNRTKINKVGIEPDEEVKLPDSVKNVLKVEEKDDTQLQKAIEMAK